MPNVPEKRIPTSNDAYAQAMQMAQIKRAEFGIQTNAINIPLLKKICKQEGIKVDLVKEIGSKIRAAYFCDEDGRSILLKKSLPQEPKLFALAHELKHHFLDRDLIEQGEIRCGDYNRNKTIEIAAEIFAAEFLFPEEEMRNMVKEMGVQAGSCTEEQIVQIKRNSPVPVSYIFIRKRLFRYGIITEGQFAKTQFKKLEETIHPPLHKEGWFKAYRARKAKTNGRVSF